MVEAEVEIVNEKGLHARASAKLVQVASSFPCEVRLSYGGEEVDAKSILGLLLVGAPLGATVLLRCEGPEEEPALGALRALIANRFEEES
ncbi:MAG: HPr family phosphocarrier protein [Acidobacteriota bacterium]